MPSKNEIASAKVAHLARDGGPYGTVTGSVTVDMATVRRRKREMVERQITQHLQIYRSSGAELIMGSGRFLAPKTVEAKTNDGETRVLLADKVFLNVGTHAAIPNVPGLEAAQPLTHVEALELDYLPQHLIVIGGECARCVGAGRMRRQPTIHAHIRRRFSNHTRQSRRRKSQHARPPGSILHVH